MKQVLTVICLLLLLVGYLNIKRHITEATPTPTPEVIVVPSPVVVYVPSPIVQQTPPPETPTPTIPDSQRWLSQSDLQIDVDKEKSLNYYPQEIRAKVVDGVIYHSPTYAPCPPGFRWGAWVNMDDQELIRKKQRHEDQEGLKLSFFQKFEDPQTHQSRYQGVWTSR